MNSFRSTLKDQHGAVLIVVAVSMIGFIALAALAIDLGHLYVVRNELRNAADAGSLAGARFLYNADGTVVNTGANQIAYDAATANNSEKVSVDVNWTSGNAGDVQRGHWSFAGRTFTPNASTAPVDLWNVSTEELDADINFINAIKVVARRQTLPAASFFAGIFGHENFQLSAEAVAYIGFAGTLQTGEADQPIAICAQSVRDEAGNYSCNIGRMLNSGSNDATHNTAGWTNFSQPCETANANEMRQLVCGEGNPEPVGYGEGMGATGGVQQTTFDDLRDCWMNSAGDSDENGIPDLPWELKLPVIDCPGNNVSNCAELLGAVTLVVVWITEAGTPDWDDAPRFMDDWPTTGELAAIPDFDTNGEARWNSFVTHFNLKNADDLLAPYAKKSIYFLPSCEPHIPTGGTGGENFGVLAKIPVLVK
jgi:hypothetical protein